MTTRIGTNLVWALAGALLMLAPMAVEMDFGVIVVCLVWGGLLYFSAVISLGLDLLAAKPWRKRSEHAPDTESQKAQIEKTGDQETLAL